MKKNRKKIKKLEINNIILISIKKIYKITQNLKKMKNNIEVICLKMFYF
jgi:hypothetical protein